MRQITGLALAALTLTLTAGGASAANFYCSDTGIFMSCGNVADVKQYCCPQGSYASCQNNGQTAVVLINAVNCVKPPPKPRFFGAPIDRGLVPLYLTQAATYILSYRTPVYPVGTPCGNDSMSYSWEGDQSRPSIWNPPHCPTASAAGPFFLVREKFQGCYTEGTSNPVYNPGPPKVVPAGSVLWTVAGSWDPTPAAIAAAQAPCAGAAGAATTKAMPECGDGGNDWERRGTRTCEDGRERQAICDCRPVMSNDTKVWVVDHPGAENCFSHWTGKACAKAAAKSAAAAQAAVDPDPEPANSGGDGGGGGGE